MKILLLSMFLCLVAISAQARGTIILLVDISSSITAEQMELQMNSYATAMSGIPSLRNVNIEVVEFATKPALIYSGDSDGAALAFANYKRTGPWRHGSTCLGKALTLIETMIPKLPQPVILDISGDGEANCTTHESIMQSLDNMAAQGVRVNTLYIANQSGISNDVLQVNPLAASENSNYKFFESLTRNHGFTMQADNFFDFELALFDKLILEISMLK